MESKIGGILVVEKSQTNSNSVISLPLGILSILIPLIGLILGIVGVVFSRKALKEIGETNENGRGLAIFGMICSVIGIAVHFFGLLGFILYFNLQVSV